MSASLWDPHPRRFGLKFLHSARAAHPLGPPSLPPRFPPSARHTPRGIQNALTPNQWEYGGEKKAKKKRERRRGREREKISLAT